MLHRDTTVHYKRISEQMRFQLLLLLHIDGNLLNGTVLIALEQGHKNKDCHKR